MSRSPISTWSVFKVKHGPHTGMWRMRMTMDGHSVCIIDKGTWAEAIQAVAKDQGYYPQLTHIGKRHLK